MNERDDLVELEALFRDRAGEWFLYEWDGNRIANVLKAALSASSSVPQDERAAFEALRMFIKAWAACGGYPSFSYETNDLELAYIKARAALSAAAKPVEPDPQSLRVWTVEQLREFCAPGLTGAYIGTDGRPYQPLVKVSVAAKPVEAMSAEQAREVVALMGWELDAIELEDMEMLVKTTERHLADAWGVKLEGGV